MNARTAARKIEAGKIALVVLVLAAPLPLCSQTHTPAEAIALEQQGKYADAAQAWKAVTQENPRDAAAFASSLKAVGVDFVCISSGGISADARPTLVANTNVQFAEKVKREAGIATRTVGLIAAPKQAEAIIAEGKADMVALARAMLDDPHWGWRAAHVLGAEVARPKQYQRAAPKMWAGAAFRD